MVLHILFQAQLGGCGGFSPQLARGEFWRESGTTVSGTHTMCNQAALDQLVHVVAVRHSERSLGERTQGFMTISNMYRCKGPAVREGLPAYCACAAPGTSIVTSATCRTSLHGNEKIDTFAWLLSTLQNSEYQIVHSNTHIHNVVSNTPRVMFCRMP